MKVIGVSNFDLESVSDILICENVSKHNGKRFVELLNQNGEHATYYYRLVEDDYKLYVFEP